MSPFSGSLLLCKIGTLIHKGLSPSLLEACTLPIGVLLIRNITLTAIPAQCCWNLQTELPSRQVQMDWSYWNPAQNLKAKKPKICTCRAIIKLTVINFNVDTVWTGEICSFNLILTFSVIIHCRNMGPQTAKTSSTNVAVGSITSPPTLLKYTSWTELQRQCYRNTIHLGTVNR